jgi:histidyl-tRNA synthetase
VKDLGGPDVPGIGFAIGCERLISISPINDKELLLPPRLFIASLGKDAQKLAFTICNRLRISGIETEMDYSGKSLKSQMKRADRLSSHYTLMLGDREIMEGKAELRNMKKGTQETLGLKNLEETIVKIIRGS